jgi:hypothetical protein
MAAVTTVKSFVAVLGPMKMEVANLSSVDDGDTYTTTIQNPSFGYFVPTSATVAATDVGSAISISGRVVTITNAALVAETGVLTIFGF